MTKRQKSAFKKKSNWHRDDTDNLFEGFKIEFYEWFIGPCYLGKKCKDQKCMLVRLNGVCCKKYSLPIHQNGSISLGLVIRDQYYCCRDCHLGGKMTGDGYP